MSCVVCHAYAVLTVITILASVVTLAIGHVTKGH
jgi:hypothetical protein